jgi:hypothetical protein
MTDNDKQASAGKTASRAAKDATDAVADAAGALSDTAADLTAEASAASRSTMEGISQAAGDAAQRAGVGAKRAAEVLTDVAGEVASSVQTHAPAVIDTSRATADIAVREVRGASSENLMLGSVFSAGLSLGLLLARAPRVLVLLALVPVFVLGGDLLGRRNSRGPWMTDKSGSTATPSKASASRSKSSTD